MSGFFSFPGDRAELAEASVCLIAARNYNTEEREDDCWEYEMHGSILSDGAACRVDFAFEKPALSFIPANWNLLLTLTRPGGKTEKYDFQVKPVRKKRRK